VKEEPYHRMWKNTLGNDLQAMGVSGIQDKAKCCQQAYLMETTCCPVFQGKNEEPSLSKNMIFTHCLNSTEWHRKSIQTVLNLEKASVCV